MCSLEATPMKSFSCHNLCRFCGNKDDVLIDIYSEEGIKNDIPNKVQQYLPIELSDSDVKSCSQCVSKITDWHVFFQNVVETDQKFQEWTSVKIEDVPVDESSLKMECIKDEIDDSINEDCHFETFEEEVNISKTETQRKNTEKKKNFFCDTCNKGFVRKSDLTRHKKNVHNESKPTAQNTEKVKTENEIIVKKKEFQCDACDQSFPTILVLNRHKRVEHEFKKLVVRRKRSELELKFFCDLCNKGFTRKYDEERHKVRQHGLTDYKVSKKRKNSEMLKECKVMENGMKFFVCNICQHKAKHSTNFLRHMAIHSNTKDYMCHICGKSFTVESTLKNHLKHFHAGVRNFKCDVCNQKFSKRYLLVEHMNRHSGNRPFSCDVCSKSFKQKSSLYIHKIFHNDVLKFNCSVCGKKFRRAYDLSIHFRCHTGQKPYSCDICEVHFRRSQDMKKHRRVHFKNNQVEDVDCPECKCTFSQERYLKIHMRVHK